MGSHRFADRADGERFFAGHAEGLRAFQAVADVIEQCGGAELRVATTQVGWARRRGFVALWDPRRWLGERGAPVVVSVALPAPDAGSAWKQVVEVRPGLWQHHREIHSAADLDEALFAAIRSAYAAAE